MLPPFGLSNSQLVTVFPTISVATVMTAMKVLLTTMSDLYSGSLEVFKFSINKEKSSDGRECRRGGTPGSSRKTIMT